MPIAQSSNRGSIFLEDAEILQHQHHAGEQHILRLLAAKCAATAQAGQFIHLQCDPSLPLRRPLSIMRINPDDHWIELLYKDVGQGTHLLASRQPGETVSVLGPIGNVFQLAEKRSTRLLIGGGVGIPPMIFLAETIARQYPQDRQNTFVIMGSEVPFPFDLAESAIAMKGIPSEINTCIADLETLGIASRLSSLQGYKGCHQGYAPDIAKQYLETLSLDQLSEVEIFSCGPLPMLTEVKKVAQAFNVGCQVSLEETMACAVGGCAGCVVEVDLSKQGKDISMKRVCVDGPVFDAETISL